LLPLSILDLSPIVAGATAADALRNSLDLARHAERWGFRRYWVAEHHNMPGVASAATAVVIGHLAGGTTSIRVGAGGVMLPNHAPLVVAEQFGTLESLYPGRIDLGLGRAPGTDPVTTHALRRRGNLDAESFPNDVIELQSYFRAVTPGQLVRAVPGAGLNVPIWILGSSAFGAQLAAELGLPFAFATHFAPDLLMQALAIYRGAFTPSDSLPEPYVMLAIPVIAADTDAEARRLFTSSQQSMISLRRGMPRQLPPPVDTMEAVWTPEERAMVERTYRYAVVGTPDTVRAGIESFVEHTSPNEIMITAHVYDHAARLRSFEIVGMLNAEWEKRENVRI
jgi:luciferase family oxidoreductase group 1